VSRRRRGLLLVGLAVVLGVLAASDVSRREAALDRRLAPLVDVLVARRDLHAGRRPGADDLAVRAVPARWAPVDGVPSATEAESAELAGPVPAGAYLTERDLAAQDGAGPPGVRPGERAVEVVATASADLVAAGSHVDVLVTREGAGTRLALQDVEVLAARPAPEPAAGSDTGPRLAATLRVTVRQAVYLTAAQAFAREVRLLPRAPGDRATDAGVRVPEALG
jgi:pilus assembly protein CpaB